MVIVFLENKQIMYSFYNLQGHLLLCKSGVVNFEREYQSLPPDTKILVMPHLSCISDQILGKLNFQAKI